MADWPVWVWALIAVVALVIIIAIIFASRQQKPVDAPRQDEPVPGEAPMEARRGIPDAEPADTITSDPDIPGRVPPEAAGRHVDEEHLPEDPSLDAVAESLDQIDESVLADDADDSLDEDTLHSPLTIPDDTTASPSSPTRAASTDETRADDDAVDALPAHAVVEQEVVEATATESVQEDFAADEPALEEEYAEDAVLLDESEVESDEAPAQLGDVEDLDVEHSTREDTAELGEDQGDIDDGRAEADDHVPGQVGTTEDVGDSQPAGAEDAPDQLGDVEDLSVGTTDSTVPATEPDASTESEQDEPRDEQGRRLDPYGNPVGDPFEGTPQYADRGDYGDPFLEEVPDDDVPRDDSGRRLDPYGNPVDGPDLPPMPGIRP